MRILICAFGAFLLDLLLGDPEWLRPWHPVVLMGRMIAWLETRLRSCFPTTSRGEYHAGIVLTAVMSLGTLILCRLILAILDRIWLPLSCALELVWCWESLAVRDLRIEAERVQKALSVEGLPAARNAVARIVGRETQKLDEAGVIRAAVETVAENFADGVTAPLFYMLIGGAPLALFCKAVNTMDSMIGYRNERYLYFGRAAARLDDAVNYIPARLGALLLIAAAWFCGEDAKAALRIWKRDRRKHASPNSGQCEAAMAGALGLRLCGPASYFGVLHEKPWIGDARREICPDDIGRACRMETTGSCLCLILLCLLRYILVMS